jgi:AraC family transcriptional regulator of adaptative response/methylated-DNA-[protein]-cysteine methyltransferase
MIGRMQHFDTPLGAMLGICTDSGVRLLEFLERRGLESELRDLGPRLGCTILPGDNAVSRQLRRELDEYFAGTRKKFTVPLEPVGTPFQRRVWDVLCDIPYGETRSYGVQARVAGYPAAVRAVARANGDNRIAILIPCHRVIGANGKLTGYGGGLWRKQHLLDLESGQLQFGRETADARAAKQRAS